MLASDRERSHKWLGCMLTTAPVQAATFDVQITVGKSKYYSDSMMAFLSFEGLAFVGSVAVVETFGIGG